MTLNDRGMFKVPELTAQQPLFRGGGETLNCAKKYTNNTCAKAHSTPYKNNYLSIQLGNTKHKLASIF